jgi:hypothetical protein
MTVDQATEERQRLLQDMFSGNSADDLAEHAYLPAPLWESRELRSSVQIGHGVHITKNVMDGNTVLKVYDYKDGNPGTDKIRSVLLSPEDVQELIKHLQE